MNDEYPDDVVPFEGRGERPNPLVNLEAEMCVIGGLLANANILEQVEDALEPHYFAFEGYQRLYEMCRDAIIENGNADPITIRHALSMSGELERFGGNEWFASVVTAVSGPMMARGQAQVIRDLYYRRALVELANTIRQDATGHEGDAKDLIEDTERTLSELVGDSADKNSRSREAAINSTLLQLQERFNNPGAVVGVSTGLEALDRKLMGLQGGNLIIVAGRPGMGKTALAQKIAEANADRYQKSQSEDGQPVAFFSLEMEAEEINERLVSDRTNTPLAWLRSGKYHNPDAFSEVVIGTQALNTLPLYIDDTGGLTARGIWARARRLKRRYGIGLVVIDQLSHIRPSDPSIRRVEALGQVTKELKIMAKELDVPVILLHQLSRTVETRDDKRPMLADLRDSGEIEQDADVVMFVYREQYYLERTEPAQRADESTEKFNMRHAQWQERLKAVTNMAEVIIAKQRMGNIGKAMVSFHGTYTRFGNAAEQEEMNYG